VNGQFDASLLEQDLSIRKDRGEFESEVRESLLGQHIQSLVVDGVQVGDGELQDRYRLDHEQVSLAFVRTGAADFAKGAELSDDDLRAYLAAHEDRYRAPTTVRARYVAYRSADFASQVQVTDGEVAEYYELH
jgi:peptidyl-prolyl cis-trans isomerase D